MGIISNLLFGDNSNKTSYKDAATQKAYSQITADTYDRQYGDMADYLNNNYSGGAGAFKTNLLTGLEDNAKNSFNNYKATKNQYFGNGLIGSLLNPIAQTADSIGGLAGMAISGGKFNPWDGSNDYLGDKRDIGSDLGALGETALTLIPLGKGLSVAKAGKAVKAAKAAGTVIEPGTKLAKQAAIFAKSQVPKTIGQKVAGGALMGAGYGASGSLRDMGFENFDAGKFGLSTALGAGIGGGLAGLGGLWNKYAPATRTETITTAGDAMPYQEALEKLKSNATGARYSDVATNLPTTKGPDLARITLDNLDDDTLKSLYRSAATNTHPDKVGEAVGDSLFKSVNESNSLLQDFLKNGVPSTTTTKTIPLSKMERLKAFGSSMANTKTGTKISSLLKTKKGKILAGGGAGLLLAQLLRNKGQNNNQMSNEELQELYNYIYGGGQ